MIYDYTHHRYVLTEKAVLQELGVNLQTYLDQSGDANPSTMAQRIAKMISAHFYAWVYAHTTNKRYVEYLLAKYPPCREIVRECLVNETYYALKNGDFWNYADDEHGFDKKVSQTTRLLLEEPLPNGFRLLYRGAFSSLAPSTDDYRKDY